MISERYKRESIARDRMIAHFEKGVFDRCLLNAVLPEKCRMAARRQKTILRLVEQERIEFCFQAQLPLDVR